MNADHVALAKLKLPAPTQRPAELKQLEALLDEGETVVTMAEALFRSGRRERRGLAVLTDRRLLCVDKGSMPTELLAIPLSDITTLESGWSGGMGDARRGELEIVAGDVPTTVFRINPWQRAGEIRAAVLESPDVTLAA